MPKLLTKPHNYTLERLQELRREADIAGDTASRDTLAAKIREMGGTVPTGVIPENETKMGRLERLQFDALGVNDTETAEKLAELIAEAQVKENGIVPEAEPEPPHGSEGTKFDEYPKDAPTPHEGRDLVGAGDETNKEAIGRLMKESSDKLEATTAETTAGYEAIDRKSVV